MATKNIITVKKNQIDPTASLSYCLGVSIVHLALAVTYFFVKKPDASQAANMEIECQQEAAAYEDIMNYMFIIHILVFIATIYREIFTAKTNLFG